MGVPLGLLCQYKKPVICAKISKLLRDREYDIQDFFKNDIILLYNVRCTYGPGEYSPEVWVGLCGLLLETFTLFETKI